jgi:hypothetical protein
MCRARFTKDDPAPSLLASLKFQPGPVKNRAFSFAGVTPAGAVHPRMDNLLALPRYPASPQIKTLLP